jgi:triacylglycerol lipase
MRTTLSTASMIGLAIAMTAGLNACALDDPDSDSESLASVVDYAKTRHPIVLLPGILGFERLFGVVEYFPAITEALADGGAEVFIAVGSTANSSEVRAEQIIPQVEEILAITGASKVNLVGHSQGSIDARVIAARRPDLVASVTSIGGPHQGAALATRVVEGWLGPLPELLIGGLADFFALITGSSDPNDVEDALYMLSAYGMAEINARYPAALPTTPCGEGAPVVDGIHYYSWSGVATLTNAVDLLDPLWLLASLTALERNDGLVAPCSSHLGEVIRDDYMQNHIDQTNLMFGLVMPLGPRPQAIFRSHANRLQQAGL